MSEQVFRGYTPEQDLAFAERRAAEMARWRRFKHATIILIPELFGDYTSGSEAEPPVAPPEEG